MRHFSFYAQKQGQQRRAFSKLSTGQVGPIAALILSAL
jgi:hypothetical protein